MARLYKIRSRGSVLQAGVFYFLIVFSAGFALGLMRVLWVVPHLGTRTAELIEMPVLLVVIILTARWLVRRLSISSSLWARTRMGLIALGCLLFTEFGAVLQLRGLSLGDYLASRDPVSGAAYYVMLFVFAVMPCLVHKNTNNNKKIFYR